MVRDLDDVRGDRAGRDQRLLALALDVAEEEEAASREPDPDHQRVVVDRAHRIGGRVRQRAGAVVVDRTEHVERDAVILARDAERRRDDAGAARAQRGQHVVEGRQARLAARRVPGRRRRHPQLADRHAIGEREQAEVVIGVRV